MVDEALAVMGLVAVWPSTDVEEFYLWPENLQAWKLFSSAQTQWHVGPGGPIGMNYQGVEVIMRKSRIKRADEGHLFQMIQAMEWETLAAWRERDNG